MQRTTLILRYGIGPVRSLSAREAAELLDVSRNRVRLLERRGVRSLAGIGRGSACAGTGVAPTTFVSVYDLLADTSTAGAQGLPALFETGVRLAKAASVVEHAGETAVPGARESGGDRRSVSPEPKEDGPLASAGPSLADPFGDGGLALDNPFFLILMAIVVACLASAAREIMRAVR